MNAITPVKAMYRNQLIAPPFWLVQPLACHAVPLETIAHTIAVMETQVHLRYSLWFIFPANIMWDNNITLSFAVSE